jgi:membrane protease YdiL (CAAX protease family)
LKLFKTANSRNNFLKLILKIILALILIQLLRAGIMFSLWWLVAPGDNTTIFQMINGLSIIITAIILLLYFKPSLKELGLNWDDIKTRTRIIYAFGIGLLIFLVFTPYTFSWEIDVLVMGIIFGLITPAFEEFMFRGYIWNKIENSDEMINSGVLTWITVTLLFSIWHLGYLDVFLLHPMAAQVNLTMILISKMGIGIVLGSIVGYLRLKTGKTYASYIFHGFWNTFAP